jgi:hypothetical protein
MTKDDIGLGPSSSPLTLTLATPAAKMVGSITTGHLKDLA